MYAALMGLILLIDATPALLIVGESTGPGIVSGVTAAIAILIARSVGQRERDELKKFVGPLLIVACIPAGWMLMQMLPVYLRWAHPVWQSAAAALGGSVVGSFSIDRGMTLMVFCNYCSIVAIMFVAAAIAVDRHRAKWILVALIGATTLIAVMIIVQHLVGIELFGGANQKDAEDAAIDCVVLGAILGATSAVRSFDKAPHAKFVPDVVRSRGLLLSVLSCDLCIAVIVGFGTRPSIFALGYGLAVFMATIVAGRFVLSGWGIAAVALVVVLVGSAVVLAQPRIYTSDPALAFAAAPESLVGVTERILEDGSWTGSGAGTFKALVPIYQDVNALVSERAPPTAASAIAVELGRPALVAAVVIAGLGIVQLIRDSLARHRSSFYPAAGASCILAATLLGFSGAGLFNRPTAIILAATIGLAFAQSKSRAAVLV